MITIITEKPSRSIDIKGYGVNAYIDKETGKKVYRVYGIVEAGSRAKLVPRDSENPLDVKDIYIDDTKIVIYRNDSKDLCLTCKGMIDAHVARGIPVFGIEEFKKWLNEQTQNKVENDTEETIEEGGVENAH